MVHVYYVIFIWLLIIALYVALLVKSPINPGDGSTDLPPETGASNALTLACYTLLMCIMAAFL